MHGRASSAEPCPPSIQSTDLSFPVLCIPGRQIDVQLKNVMRNTHSHINPNEQTSLGGAKGRSEPEGLPLKSRTGAGNTSFQ